MRTRMAAGVISTNDPVGDASFSIAAEANDVIVVSVQLKTEAGVDIAHRACVRGYLSGDANGDSLTGATISGDVTAGTDGLVLNSGGDSKKIFDLVSEADGDIDLSITHTGNDNMYLVLVMPNGKLVASGVIDFAT